MNKPITIIGAGGAIANCLAPYLIEKNEPIRLLSRRGIGMPGAQGIAVDVSNQKALIQATKDSKVVLMLIGIEYRTATWQDRWPVMMDHCINACIENNVPLIFFDNVYMYGQVEGEMTEQTPFNPCSKKGEVRAKIASYLLQQIKKNNIRASIARAADFYGPHAQEKSFFHQLVLKPMMAGKKAQWLVNSQQPHSMSYTKDMAHGLYLLTQDERTLNQTWHLPTASPALSGVELIEIINRIQSSNLACMNLNKLMIKAFGLFNADVRESVEMLYQYQFPYHFSSAKFEKYFNYQPMSYAAGLEETIKFYK